MGLMGRFLKLTFVLAVAIELVFGFPAQAIAQITKEGESYPTPGEDIFPGSQVLVTLKFPGGNAEFRSPADIMLVMDRSGSMNSLWSSPPVTKLSSAKNALKTFVDFTKEDAGLTDPGDYVGLATYAGSNCISGGVYNINACARLDLPIANMSDGVPAPEPNNKAALKSSIDSIAAGGATPIGAGLDMAIRELLNTVEPSSSSRAGVSKYIVLASDGLQNQPPSPYELGILNTAISNGFVVFTVGIGNDVTTSGVVVGGSSCGGCPDLNGNGIVTGDEVLKDVACKTDQVDPDPSQRCFAGNPTNNPNNPRNYFFAVSDAQLSNVYSAISDRISSNLYYQVLDAINTTIFSGLDPATFKVTGGPDPVDCKTAPVWPVTQQIVSPTFFLVQLNNIPAGSTVCISFVATVHNLTDLVWNGFRLVPFSRLLGGADLLGPIDTPQVSSRVAAIWDPRVNCDTDGNGRLTGLEFIRCLGILRTSPRIEIPEGSVLVKNPTRPWLKTTGGDFGSRHDVRFQRDSSAVSQSNTEFLGLSSSTLRALPNFYFSSAKSWLIENYAGGVDLYPDVDVSGSMYQPLLKKYSARCKPPVLTDQLPSTIDGLASGTGCAILSYTGDYTVGPAWSAAYTGVPAVVFVDGDLNINHNLTISNQPSGLPSGLIFVASGNVTVADSVDRVDGIYIADQFFNTSDTVNCSSFLQGASQLTINGAVYYFGEGCFRRALANNYATPAEIINFPPDYLWTFREIIGESRTVYNEVAP